MKFYDYWRSSSAWRVRIALAYKGIAVERIAINLAPGQDEQHGGAFRAKNPLGQVPVLELDGPPIDANGPPRIAQSLAILEYLEETQPVPALLPSDPRLRARARQMALMIVSGTQPMQNLAVLQRVKALGGDDKKWAADFIGRGLAALEIEAARQPGRFLVGDDLTLADVCLVPQLYNARRFAIDVTPFPTLLRVESTCRALPAFEASEPERQSDAPRSQAGN